MLNFGDRLRIYPDFIIRRLCCAPVTRSRVHRIIHLIFGGQQYELSEDDYRAIERLVRKVGTDYVDGNGLTHPFSIEDVLKIRAYAECCVANDDQDHSLFKVLFLTSNTLQGVRRCQVPATAINHQSEGKILIDCTTELRFHHALNYDAVMVQEITPQDYHTLLRLQGVGRVIIFDMDENLFDIPSLHPKAMTFSPLDRELHRNLIANADVIAVRRRELAVQIEDTTSASIVELPDMVETTWITPSPALPSPDRFEIVCIADETRQEDVDRLQEIIPEALRNYPYAHITFVGAMPTDLQQMPVPIIAVEGLPWTRVHHIPFPATAKDYYTLLSNLPMDLALAPRTTNAYNAWGSEVEIMELLAKGIPVLTDKVADSDVAQSGLTVNVSDTGEWKSVISLFCETARNSERSSKQRSEVMALFSPLTVAPQWIRELCEAISTVRARRE